MTGGGARGALERAIVAAALASSLATAVFVVHAFLFSPQNPVAAEIGFEALRVARSLPLYVDPWKGAWEDGAPPARYYVLYTPMFPWIVGKLSAAVSTSAPTLATVRVVGRSVALLGWIVVHAAPVLLAPRAGDARRRWITALAAMLSASIYFVARHAASMSPDTLATALLCLGVLRAVRVGRFDAIAAVLLVATPFVKPSCIGGIAGAGVVHLLGVRSAGARRREWLGATAAGLVAGLVFAFLSHLASDGAWLSNIARSTGQPLTLIRWVQELGSRVMVLGAPHVFVAWLGYRRRVGWIVLGPLLGSIAWTTFIMAKHGSGSHYWLEPTGLALIAIARMPGPAPAERPWVERSLPALALVFAALGAIVSWPQYLSEPGRYARHAEVTRLVDAHCVRRPGEFVVASDLVLELALNGRISVPAWQSGFLARSGKFPAEAWRDDLRRPEVRWLALAYDPRRPPGTSNDERVELSPFYDVLKDVVLETYAFDAEVAGVFVFRRR